MKNQNHSKTIEHVFRHEYGKIIAILVHKFGAIHLEKIEDAVQDALLKAMQVWAYKDIPENPTAWLLRWSLRTRSSPIFVRSRLCIPTTR